MNRAEAIDALDDAAHALAGILHNHRMHSERSLGWRISQMFARILTTLLFNLKVYGRENVPRRGGALLVSNHQSNLDPILLAVRLDRPLNYIAKSELFENPIGSWLLRKLFNAFPVRQGTGDVAAVRETIRRLQEGHLLNLYPEGARTPDGNIHEMHRGVGLIIRRAKVPVIPVAIVGAFEAWSIHRRWLRPAPIRIRYGPPMDLNDLKSETEIIAKIDSTLRAMFNEARRG